MNDKPPEFLTRRTPQAVDYAPPEHRVFSDTELLMNLAKAVEDVRLNAGDRREQIARLIAELPVHEALDMAQSINHTLPTLPPDEKPDIALMLRLNNWARFVLRAEKESGVHTVTPPSDKEASTEPGQPGRTTLLADDDTRSHAGNAA